MKKLSLITNFLVAMISLSAVAATPQSPVPSPQNNTGILSKQQAIYTLRLPANPTTGYSWFLVSYPHGALSLQKHAYLPPDAKTVGAGGDEIWQFKAKPAAFIVPQVFQIKLMYARPWEINDDTAVKTFYVVTHA